MLRVIEKAAYPCHGDGDTGWSKYMRYNVADIRSRVMDQTRAQELVI